MLENEIKKFKEKYKDLSLIAINFRNAKKELTWHLLDYNMIEDFKNNHPVIKIGSITIKADDYEIGTALIYDTNKNKKYLVNKDKLNILKEKNINFDTLATRGRMKGFGGVWKIESKKMANDYEEQLFGIKIEDHIYLSTDYQEKIFIVKNKFNNKKMLLTLDGKVPMKK